MNKQEYQKRLEEILDEQFKRLDGTEVLPIYNRPTAVGQSLQAICLLNEEAIGENIDITKLDHLTGFVQQALGKNVLKQELKSIIGTSNEN